MELRYNEPTMSKVNARDLMKFHELFAGSSERFKKAKRVFINSVSETPDPTAPMMVTVKISFKVFFDRKTNNYSTFDFVCYRAINFCMFKYAIC